ncbi:hypothetical protein ACRDU6_27445 [Mycolicibacterium sp. ELW1]|uniref:hypothetical protein n=1 Tax=Mycobacteriaceae TaxID=1762 RepID=UPI00143CC32B|nr:hypothetical protein [Mycobacterium sp. ELW1]
MTVRRNRTRNGRIVEQPKPPPIPGYYEQSGAILAALGVVTGNAETRSTAR